MALRIIAIAVFLLTVEGRRHSLSIEGDSRRNFAISTFGFLDGGGLMVDIIDISIKKEVRNVKSLVGFSLEKTGSDGISSYMEQHSDRCILKERHGLAKQVEMMLFILDFDRGKIIVEHFGSSFTTLKVNDLKLPDQAWHSNDLFGYVERLLRKLSTSILVVEEADKEIANKGSGNNTRTARGAKKKGITQASAKIDRLELPLNKTGTEFSGTITVIIDGENEGLYNLYFHNCYDAEPDKIDMKLRIIEHNKYTFLSAGEIPLPSIYGVTSAIFFIAGCVYLSMLRKLRDWTFKIHYLMAAVVFLKSFSLLFHAVNYYYIGKDGRRMESWAVLFYITHLLKGALMFTCIVLIGTGFFFVKQVLSTKEKRIFMIVIPLQILANVASIMIESTEEGKAQYKTWIFILVDLICCGTVLFPVVWSIRHLQEASKTDGKAAISLAKLKLFRHFYVLIVCYIYFTRIIVYLIKITVPFKYVWLDALCTEFAALAFFMITGYKFRPTSNNPYLHVPEDDEDDIEMDQISTQSGLADGVTRVNIKGKAMDGEKHITG